MRSWNTAVLNSQSRSYSIHQLSLQNPKATEPEPEANGQQISLSYLQQLTIAALQGYVPTLHIAISMMNYRGWLPGLPAEY
jgi:hypothetical protein